MRHTLSNTGSNSTGHRGFSARLAPVFGVALLALILATAMACGSEPQPQEGPVSTTSTDSGQQASPTSSPAVEETRQDAEPAATEATEAVSVPTTETAAATPEQPATEAPAPPATEASPAAVATVTEAATEPATSAPAATQPQPTEAPQTTVPEEPAQPEPPPPADVGGGYVIGEGSKATFTVNEKLAWLDLPNDAVMHTEGLSGSVFLDGRPSVIELDLHSMTSDSDRRDGYVQRRMFPNHRVAIFTVPDLGELPDPLPEGEVITREVQGELSIRGVTKPVTFEVDARRDPEKLFILGRTTFTWDDLEIPPPNIPGRIQVKDEVQVEVLLSAVPEGG